MAALQQMRQIGHDGVVAVVKVVHGHDCRRHVIEAEIDILRIENAQSCSAADVMGIWIHHPRKRAKGTRLQRSHTHTHTHTHDQKTEGGGKLKAPTTAVQQEPASMM